MTNSHRKEIEDFSEGATIDDLNEFLDIVEPQYKKHSKERKNMVLLGAKYKIKQNFQEYIGSLESSYDTLHNILKSNGKIG
ncbi:MAG TPA: hypothetical protein VKN14_00645 [Flavobacteriaceae bacterium]|nr:hypothetical protein [Flavobacteriaceae bacterium]